MDSAVGLEHLFHLRHGIARIGEADWFRWWESNALTAAGQYAMPRLFRRTPELSAAHIAFATARARHHAALPDEPLVHLFDFGELLEGGFERWLIARKGEAWKPPVLPAAPTEEQKTSAVASLRGLGIEPSDLENVNGGEVVVVGVISEAELATPAGRSRVSRRLAGAYAASAPGRLVVPYFRMEH